MAVIVIVTMRLEGRRVGIVEDGLQSTTSEEQIIVWQFLVGKHLSFSPYLKASGLHCSTGFKRLCVVFTGDGDEGGNARRVWQSYHRNNNHPE